MKKILSKFKKKENDELPKFVNVPFLTYYSYTHDMSFNYFAKKIFLKPVRYYIIEDNDYYYAYSLEFCLFAHGDSLSKANRNLDKKVCQYVSQAWKENEKNKKRLLKRKASLPRYFDYYIRTRLDKSYKKYNLTYSFLIQQ